ncbi:MAG: hypothetical protein AMXMBFR64_04580 [Myxococcales bacterium]
MKLRFAGASHVGHRRTNNEDSYAILPEYGLFAVADGMGGYLAGEVASRMAVDSVREFFEETRDDEDITWPYREEETLSYDENRLSVAIKLANGLIYRTAQRDPKCKQMGTTIVTALFSDSGLAVAHVGDSRAYLLRDGALRQLTEDHSLLNDFRKLHPSVTEADLTGFRYKNVIVRALGMQDHVDVELQRHVPQPGDLYVLCSDGLTGDVPDPELEAVLTSRNGDLCVAAQHLVEVACEHGGRDNVTVVLVEVDEW